MKRTLVIITVSLLSLGLGYWIGQMKSSADGLVDNLKKKDQDSLRPIELKKDKEDFSNFLYTFIIDSTFQTERIKFPLKSITVSDTVDYDSVFIKREDWKTTRLFGNEQYKAQIYDNFERELRDTDERAFCWEGFENDVLIVYKFKRIDGLWYLIEFDDFSL